VYSNCSGKHTAMLALAKHHGWPTEFYTRRDHPVQQRCLLEVSKWSDVPAERIGVAVDGCGVACFAVPLRAMALAYARLSEMRSAEFGVRNGAAMTADPFRTPQSAFRIPEAMLRHPELLAGEGRPCTEMMRAHPGRVITKVGADGVYSALLVQERLGVALKVADGHGASAALAMAAVLAELGLRPQPATLLAKPVTNWRGEPVGELRVNGGLER
jgi:L-asparaginase II